MNMVPNLIFAEKITYKVGNKATMNEGAEEILPVMKKHADTSNVSLVPAVLPTSNTRLNQENETNWTYLHEVEKWTICIYLPNLPPRQLAWANKQKHRCSSLHPQQKGYLRKLDMHVPLEKEAVLSLPTQKGSINFGTITDEDLDNIASDVPETQVTSITETPKKKTKAEGNDA